MHNSKQTVSDTFEKLSVPALPDREVYIREHPPAHFSLKFTSFTLLEKTNVEKYDSGIFEAEGFKWRLSLYPNGDKKMGGAGHLSLYIAIEETGNHTHGHGWEVNAIIKLFVFDQTRNSYLTIQDANGAVTRFHEQKKEWGFSKLMMLDAFKQPSRGYLVDDTCVFGAEVFVVAPSGNWESHAMVKPHDNKYAWKIENFSKKDNNNCFSHHFFIGNQHWQMRVWPKGSGEQYGKCLSVYLGLVGAANFPPKRKIYAAFKLRVVDQLHQRHLEKPVYGHWFDSEASWYGYHIFMQLKDLHTPAKGFIHNDTIIVEVEIHTLSEIKMMT